MVRRRLDQHFRSWLVQRMYAARCQKIDEQVDRFEVVANTLSHEDQRRVDFDTLAEASGYPAKILKDTIQRLGKQFELIEVRRDVEGVWYSLTRDPFSPPEPEEDDEPLPTVESLMERLYRECCDEINDGLRRTVSKLENLRRQIEPAEAAILMDACADILTLREKLTRISATGVKDNREGYIKELREDLRAMLKGR